MKKDFISLKDLSAQEIEKIFGLTDKIKKNSQKFSQALEGKSIGLIFQKPSNRTRVSFDVGIWQLGGHPVYLSPEEIDLGKRETISDAAKTLSRYLDAVVLRTFLHQDIIDFAKAAAIPVINGLSDFEHPCQILADIYTINKKKKYLKGITLAYVGDGNNVCHSLLFGASKMGINIKVACPKNYEPNKEVVGAAKKFAKKARSLVSLTNSAKEATKDADVIYTDVWASMGKEHEIEERKKVFAEFQVSSRLVSYAKKDFIFMHCLPAHRSQEVIDEIIDGKHSVVFEQAENRLHVQKAILVFLLGERL
ncbi:MAG: ornithine carbamoyltransferase [Candidatus Omnitrophota bacterium]|nr:ornithine carbamoyltransferase [Candidatus Omnitrophota bacterium]